MILVAALILFVIIFVAALAGKKGIPLVVISLLAGILFGSDVFGLINFNDYNMAQQIANFALVFVLFIGGFGTKKERMKSVLAPAMVLATAGVIITAVVTALLLNILLDFPLQMSILIGCIIASTDAAAVFSILRSRSLNPKLSAVVEVESATNDPMAIILTTVAVQLAAASMPSGINQSILQLAIHLSWQIIGGVGIGMLVGYGGVYACKYLVKLDKGYFYIYIIAIIMFSFGLADFTKTSGILSAFFAGYILGNSNISYKSNTSNLLDAVSTIGNVAIFVLLGLLVHPKDFTEVFIDGIFLFLILTFIARPIAVICSTFFTKYTVKEKIFLSWSGLRGAVPIVLATYPLVAGLEGATFIFNIVFFAVLLSMMIQGSTITMLADKLKLASKARPKPKQCMELVALHNSDMELIEVDIDDKTYKGIVPVSELRLPKHTTITMVNRDDKIMAPTGRTKIIPGDILYILAKTNEIDNATNEIFDHFDMIEEI